MQEQQQTKQKSQLHLQHFKCINNNQGFSVCFSQKCQKPGIMCLNPKCKCYEQHDACNFTKLKFILNEINKIRKKKIPYEIKDAYQLIIKFINDMIQQLSQERQKFLQEIDRYALTNKQIQFIKIFEEGTFDKINESKNNQDKKQIKIIKLQEQIKDKIVLNGVRFHSLIAQFRDSYFNHYDSRKFQQTYMDEGDFYRGTFNIQHKADGFGIQKSQKWGVIYQGEWKNGKYHGRGKFSQKQTNYYFQGQFKNGLSHGKGTQYKDDKVISQGNWIKNKLDGLCKFYDQDGNIRQVKFVNGKQLGKQSLQFQDQNDQNQKQ